jgi:hypothetical protein
MLRVHGVRLPWLDIIIIMLMGVLLGTAIGLWLVAP